MDSWAVTELIVGHSRKERDINKPRTGKERYLPRGQVAECKDSLSFVGRDQYIEHTRIEEVVLNILGACESLSSRDSGTSVTVRLGTVYAVRNTVCVERCAQSDVRQLSNDCHAGVPGFTNSIHLVDETSAGDS